MKIKLIIFLAVLAVTAACAKKADEIKALTVTKQNLLTVQKEVKASKTLTEEEVTAYMLGQMKLGTSVDGKTVGQIIDAGKSQAPAAGK